MTGETPKVRSDGSGCAADRGDTGGFGGDGGCGAVNSEEGGGGGDGDYTGGRGDTGGGDAGNCDVGGGGGVVVFSSWYAVWNAVYLTSHLIIR